MNKFLIINSLFIFTCLNSGATGPSEKDYRSLPKILKQNGINPEDVKIERSDLIWQTTCNNAAGDEPGAKGVIIFDAKVVKPLKIKDLMLNKGSTISFCEGEVRSIIDNFDAHGKLIDFEKDGFSCSGVIALNKKGQLCRCMLAKDTQVDGFMVPRGTEMILKNGKPHSFLFLSRDPRVKDYLEGIFSIKNGKPIASSEKDHSCNFEE